MQLKGRAKLLRIFIGEANRVYKRPLYEVIVYAAKRFGLAGATVVRGVMSYGASSRIHSIKILALSEDLPVIVEIVDHEQKINKFVPILDKLIEKSGGGGLITMEPVEVIRYSPKH